MILLKNINYINAQTFEITTCNLLIEEGIDKNIQTVNTEEIARLKEDFQSIDCSGKYAIKSFVNAHHHAYSALATGMPQPVESPINFLEILQKVWWNLDKVLNKEMIEISAAVTALKSAKNGVSFVIDHHASPFAHKTQNIKCTVLLATNEWT